LDSVQLLAITSDEFTALSTAQIAAISTAALGYIVSTQVDGLSATQIAVLSANTIDLWTSQNISVLLSAEMQSLTTAQLAVFDSLQLLAISSDELATLSTAQIAAIPTAAMAYLNSLQVDGLTSTQVAALSANTIDLWTGASSVNITMLGSAEMSSMTTAQFNVLDSQQVSAITATDFTVLSVTQLAAIGSSSYVGMLSSQLQALGSTQMGSLATSQLTYIASSQFQYMTSVQLMGMTSTQIGVLGDNYGNMDSTALTAIFSVQLTALNTILNLTTTAARQASWGFVTPIVLDLDGDGIQTTTAQNGVTFDINNDGKADQTAWVARGDGLLVRDINKDGAINNGSELFGSATSLGNGKTAADGYVAMRALDTNNDGVLDANDAAFGELMVWTDLDGNGVTGANELKNLSDLGINSISLNATKSTENNNGNLIGLMGSYTTTDGKTHTMGDVWFQTDAAGDRVFDLAAIAKAAGTSKVDMSNAQGDTLKVTLADVLAVGTPDILSGTSTVTITGDSGDVVQLTGSAGAGWSLAGTQTDGADTYMVYVNQNAHLMVNDKIHLIIN